MPEKYCLHCESSNLKLKEIELRQINSKTMRLASRQHMIEVECLDCEWVEILEVPEKVPEPEKITEKVPLGL